MSPITFDQFKNTLTAAASQRGRDYTNVYSVTVRWEQDDTQADKDPDRFQRMLKDLNVGAATELIIRHNDSTPALTFQQALLEIIRKSKANSESDHNLFILHYAGHGIMKDGSFTFAETKGAKKTINADRILLAQVKDPQAISDSDHLDVLLIFDCCYAHVATRAPTTQRRVVEVIAATSAQTPMARSAPHNTFTGKLAGEIARRKRSGHKNVEFADLFQTLRLRVDSKIRPTHSILVGVASVLLPLNGPRTIDPTSIPPDYTALFSVSVSRDLSTDEMKELSAWMRSLPRFAGLNIDKVYHTQSMCFIMRSALSVYAKLHKLDGYSLIAENPSPPLDLDGLLQPGPSAAAPKKENIPFRVEK
ncbi:hypothetical protein BO71DRAFT_38512 [Aspergillus ellipticus CBS 707.79]|uniref:Peptidase C14 caspase domain-containing protein n=1 Tax=Aspergillus ellipticus CBS 707.79 TaxID=1448320 RepID=A0A319D2Z9_9EURO|nr:hypothetical protein BO71DRAFT_38512 [Aspergillus ellipticus CBS 707.79]